MREDFGFFWTTVAPDRPPQPWQLPLFVSGKRFSVLAAGRQMGKSFGLAQRCIWQGFRLPAQRILIVSASEQSSFRLLHEVRSIVRGSALLSASVTVDQQGLVRFSNGSEIAAVAASDAAIRGRSVDLLAVDECPLIAPAIVTDAALPTTTGRPSAQVLLVGSATIAAGPFYDMFRMGEVGSEHVDSFRHVSTLVGGECDAPWYSPRGAEAAREIMYGDRFAAEYQAVFGAGSDRLFPRINVCGFVPDPLGSMHGPGRVFVGLDWGAVANRSALVALGRLPVSTSEGLPVFGVRCSRRWRAGAPLPDVVAEIAASPAHYDCVNSERNGLGEMATQSLWKALSRRSYFAGGAPSKPKYFMLDEFETPEEMRSRALRLRRPAGVFHTEKRGVVTTARTKSACYAQLRMLFDRGQLVVSADHEDLQRELTFMSVQWTVRGDERIEAERGDDDVADSLSLSLTPYLDGQGRWRTLVGDLSEPRGPFAVREAPAGVELVNGPGFMVPRRPAWLSVRAGRDPTVGRG